MITYILIYIMGGSFAGVSGHIEFSSKKACEAAMEEMRTHAPASRIFIFCTEKR